MPPALNQSKKSENRYWNDSVTKFVVTKKKKRNSKIATAVKCDMPEIAFKIDPANLDKMLFANNKNRFRAVTDWL